MPAHLSLAEQEREWRKTGRAAGLSLSMITEKGQRMMCDTGRRQRDPSSDVKPTALEAKRKACAPSHTKSAQIYIKRNGNTAESNALNVDERLRLARERREAHQKQLALRERGWLAREERARQFFEKHLEERRKKLEEQRQREERRRNAVEEKRRQRLKEERERYESVVRRTIEKSQKAKQKLAHCSRRVTNNTRSNTNAKRRSLSQWETELVSRLQTPTISYLARSRSAVCPSRDTVVHVCRRSASCHSMSSSNTQQAKMHGKVANRPANTSSNVTIRRTTNRELFQVAKCDSEGKDLRKTQLQTTNEIKPKQDINRQENIVQTPPGLQNRPHVRHSALKQDGLPPLPEEEDLEPEHELTSCPLQPDKPSPQYLQIAVKQDNQLQLNPTTDEPCSRMANGLSPIGDGGQARPTAWTTNPEEATRLLAEKRRQARLQREREEEEQRQKEETERRTREELARRRAEERARQEEEARMQEEKMRKREEEERLRAEEENARRQKEEELKLQQQKEEEARQKVLEEQQRLEREKRFQREEAERQERKKRLEEIMKRTRKTDPEDKKPASVSITVKETVPSENIKPKSPKLEMREEGDMLPTVAFKERRSFRSLSGLDEIQAHQQTEVI